MCFTITPKYYPMDLILWHFVKSIHDIAKINRNINTSKIFFYCLCLIYALQKVIDTTVPKSAVHWREGVQVYKDNKSPTPREKPTPPKRHYPSQW